MSISVNSSSSVLRKKQEEQNAKVIRELAAIQANKYCFECGQRGPTWVNVSEGTFCCMHCAGLLRGLNPPHKVKSISMSTFTPEEIEKLRAFGNEENARIWLGLYDGQVKFQPRVDDEVKQHLIQKYEYKKWYVSPVELAQQRKLLAEHSRRDSSSALSIHSQQSIQSSPANLNPNSQKNNDLLDLLSSDAFSTPTPSSTAFSSSCIPTSMKTHVVQTYPTIALNPPVVPTRPTNAGFSTKRDVFSMSEINSQPNNPLVKINPTQQLNNDLLDLLSSDFFRTTTFPNSSTSTMPASNSTSVPIKNTDFSSTNGATLGIKRDTFSMSALSNQPNNPFAPVNNPMPNSQPNSTMANMNNWNPFAS